MEINNSNILLRILGKDYSFHHSTLITLPLPHISDEQKLFAHWNSVKHVGSTGVQAKLWCSMTEEGWGSIRGQNCIT